MKKISICILGAMVAFAVAAPRLRAYVTAKRLSVAGVIVQQKWKSAAFPITWRLNPTQGTNVTGTRTQLQVLTSSFTPWTQISTAAVSFTQGADTPLTTGPQYDQINVVSSNISAASYAPVGGSALGVTLVYAFDDGGPGLVDEFSRPIEFAGQMLEADIFFNPTVGFSTNTTTPSDKIDFQTVATHEIGHFLGLDHSTLVSATMFPTIASGYSYPRALSNDDAAAMSVIYPTASFASKGKISGTVRNMSGTAVYGAVVVAVNSSGAPVAGSITNPSGVYTIEGLDAGAYTVYAEPMDGPYTIGNTQTLTRIYPSATVSTSFTTRFH